VAAAKIIHVIALVLVLFTTKISASDELQIQRLTWAGIKLVAGDTTVLIDAVGKDLWDGNAPQGLVPVEVNTSRRYALVTHAHNDHFDIDTLKDVLGERGYAVVHESIATHVASRGLRVISAKSYEPVLRGGFVFVAVPAVDGFGEAQVSWIVSHGEHRYLHAGDTLWHGNWATVGETYGPFDTAFLPINGAKIRQDPMPDTPRSMTPTQAVDAALLLRAQSIVPIHYGLDDPPYYTEVAEPLATLRQIAERRGVPVVALQPGDTRSPEALLSGE
jgi:L-ascorbate metabolism protein UlaG (beta-lactamase superfamily)